MNNVDLTAESSHFAFGENWASFAKGIDQAVISEAKKGLSDLIPAASMPLASFLDIGCGSGLHALAALELGVAHVTAIDIDRNSVRTTEKVLSNYCEQERASVQRLSIFEADVAELGAFDIVYSWGVLHHTGEMWRAVEKASELVKPGGFFVIALYQKRLFCKAWKVEKRIYSFSPKTVQGIARAIYCAALLVGHTLIGRNPFSVVRNYKSARGMDFWHDAHDWLGGYPYESATRDDVHVHVVPRGFTLVKERILPWRLGILGTGCAEYCFQKAG